MEYQIDEQFRDEINLHKWHKIGKYISTGLYCEHGKYTVYMQKMIVFLEFFPNLCFCDTFLSLSHLTVDHYNNDQHDNRLCNLQVIPRSLNSSKGNHKGTSKYLGVSWNKQNSKWRANFNLHGKQKHIGLFDSETDAAQAYNKYVTDNGIQHRPLNIILPKIKPRIIKR
jgi:AP2 domain